MNDRITKVLLTLLVVGVWGLLLRPLLSATPAQAQQQPDRTQTGGLVSSAPAMVVVGSGIYVASDGYVTYFSTQGGTQLNRGSSEKLPSR